LTYSFVVATLNPHIHYAYGTVVSVMQDLKEAFEYMADTETCVAALQEADHYRQKHGTFSNDLAWKMAHNSNSSLGMFANLHIHY
jgi:hypothetical protein